MATGTTEHVHGRYLIRVLVAGDKVRARAFLDRTVIADTTGSSVDEALRTMRATLDARDALHRETRKGGVPSAEEYKDAFTHVAAKIGAHHWLMLKAMLAAPDLSLTASQIAAAAGYPSFASANAHFGILAGMIAEDLDYQPETRADGSPIWTMALATGADPQPSENGDSWRWKLRPQVAECLRGMNIGEGK